MGLLAGQWVGILHDWGQNGYTAKRSDSHLVYLVNKVYLGPSASTGLLRNVFGGPVVFFSANALREVGGYHDLPAGYDHWCDTSAYNTRHIWSIFLPVYPLPLQQDSNLG